MKKIIALVLTAVLMLVSFTVFAETDTDDIFSQMAKMTKEERAQYFGLARPFFTTDAGVDAALANIEAGTFAPMFEKVFSGDVDNDFLKRVFLSMKSIKESTGIRLKYADIIQKKIPIEGASSTTISGIEKLLGYLYQKSSDAEKVLKEDGYTAEVIANVLKIFKEINGEACLNYENKIFGVGRLNQTFANDFDSVWRGYSKPITAYSLFESLAGTFNRVSESDRDALANSLKDLGVCEIVKTEGGTGGGTGGGATETEKEEPTIDTEKTENYEVIKTLDGVSADIFKDSVVIKTTKNAAKTVEVLVDAENPVVKKLQKDGKLETVVYSIPTDKGVKLLAEPEAVYVISSHPYPFTDANGWGKSYIAALNARGIINGKSDTSFAPEEKITREEFIKLVVSLFGLLDENAELTFTDVSAGAWYAKYVASAKKAGITDGLGDGSFGVGKNITRQDMAKIISTVLSSYNVVSTELYYEFKDSGDISSYAQEHIQKIANLGIISGDDNKNFNPKNFATRQEAAKMVYGMLNCYILHN